MELFLQICYTFLFYYRYLLIMFVIFSWLPNLRGSVLYQWLGKIVMPYLGRFRRILPPIAGLDFSPIIAFLLLDFAQRGLASLIVNL